MNVPFLNDFPCYFKDYQGWVINSTMGINVMLTHRNFTLLSTSFFSSFACLTAKLRSAKINYVSLCLFNSPFDQQSCNHCLHRVWHRLVPEVQGLMDGLVETRLCIASAAIQDAQDSGVKLTAEEQKFYSNLRLMIVDCITAPFAPFIGPFPVESEFTP